MLTVVRDRNPQWEWGCFPYIGLRCSDLLFEQGGIKNKDTKAPLSVGKAVFLGTRLRCHFTQCHCRSLVTVWSVHRSKKMVAFHWFFHVKAAHLEMILLMNVFFNFFKNHFNSQQSVNSLFFSQADRSKYDILCFNDTPPCAWRASSSFVSSLLGEMDTFKADPIPLCVNNILLDKCSHHSAVHVGTSAVLECSADPRECKHSPAKSVSCAVPTMIHTRVNGWTFCRSGGLIDWSCSAPEVISFTVHTVYQPFIKLFILRIFWRHRGVSMWHWAAGKSVHSVPGGENTEYQSIQLNRKQSFLFVMSTQVDQRREEASYV